LLTLGFESVDMASEEEVSRLFPRFSLRAPIKL
jgi:hypothetical protein